MFKRIFVEFCTDVITNLLPAIAEKAHDKQNYIKCFGSNNFKRRGREFEFVIAKDENLAQFCVSFWLL